MRSSIRRTTAEASSANPRVVPDLVGLGLRCGLDRLTLHAGIGQDVLHLALGLHAQPPERIGLGARLAPDVLAFLAGHLQHVLGGLLRRCEHRVHAGAIPLSSSATTVSSATVSASSALILGDSNGGCGWHLPFCRRGPPKPETLELAVG